MAKLKTKPFDPAEFLDTPEAMAAYLEDALTDSSVEFLEALGVVARARGMTELARRLEVSRESLYRSLSGAGHPDFSTVAAALKVYGLQLTVSPTATA